MGTTWAPKWPLFSLPSTPENHEPPPMALSCPWFFNNLGSLLSLSEKPQMGHLDGVLRVATLHLRILVPFGVVVICAF
jgi:hypothetical protein